jgi:hypothetical protein
MRLWSIHPKYLDSKGLVALWREALLAQKVLAGQTRGYTQHPQLIRFRENSNPEKAMALYLHSVYKEAEQRGYQFDKNKINGRPREGLQLTVTRGQIQFEKNHLSNKLSTRNPEQFNKLLKVKRIQPHPLFRIVPGERASWER